MSGIDIDSFLDLSQLSSLDAIEFCEVLWLAKYMKTNRELYSPQNNDKKRQTSEHKPSKNNPLPTNQNETMSKAEVKTTYNEDVNEQNIPLKIDNNASNYDRVAIHHKGYFDDTGQLSTYLIDFRQKILSRKRDILDEEKTVDNFIQTNIFLPFFKSKKQKKYELYIFIDKSDSMNIWEEMVGVYRKLLQNSGVFKATRIVYFNTTKSKTYFYRDKLETKSFSPKEIINYHNNKIIFILTDMLSEAWKQGDALKKFVNLNKSIPLFLIQMLPYRLWRSTLLQKASITTFNATLPYPKSKNYQSEVDFLLDEDSDMQSFKLPIIDFNLAYLKKIGKVLKAKENNYIDGAIFDKVENLFIEYKEEKYLSAQDHIDIFFANASQKARELAISFSAVPLNLPIMRMIQEKVLDENNNLYIAEVLNSTLLEKNGEIFEFKTIDGEDIGEIFLKLLGREKALEILYENSDYIEENLHTNFSFKALLAGDIDLDDINIEGNDKIFASIACKVLQRLGKDYAKKAGCSGKKGRKKLKEYTADTEEKSVNKPSKSIRVIGVGGGGNNVIDYMVSKGIHTIDLIAANTDAQALDSSLAPFKMQLGMNATRGLGAGMIPDKGREAALESFDDIKEMLEGSDLVFISAGLGGGTGTGAAPIIAQAAKEVGALTVSIVTSPFKFEGSKRIKLAKDGLEELKRESDSIIVVPNEKLLPIVEKNLGIKESFRMVDDILAQAIAAISNVTLSHGDNDINLDFNDVRTVMIHKGLAHMGTGYFVGDNAAYNAAKSAIESPLLDSISIDGAMGILVQFEMNQDYLIADLSKAMEMFYDLADEDADVIFGTTTNDNMKIDEVRVTLIATGLEKASEVETTQRVIQQLKDQGWDAKDIELDYKISNNNHRADIVLLQENEPISVIEVKSRLNNENMAKAIEQVKFYAKKLDIHLGYVSDGKKIYEYDIAKKSYELIMMYPSSIDLEEKVSVAKKRKYLTLLPSQNIIKMDYYLENKKQIQDFPYIVNQRNFVVINGNVGAGKTTFIINYLTNKEKDYDYIAYIKNNDSFFRNLKDQLLESMNFDITDTINNIINKLSLLAGNKILVLDDVDDAITKYEDYLIKLANANWKIILITQAEHFNFKRIGEEVQNDIYYHTLHPYTYEDLSTLFNTSTIDNSYPKTGKIVTILDGLSDKKLLQIGSGLSNDFEILTLAGLDEIFMHDGIKSTRVLSYYEGRPNIVDMIMNFEIDLVILQISPNMSKDELHNVFRIFQTAQQNDVPLIVDTKQLDKFISDLALVYYECTACDRLHSFTCNELEWGTISGSEGSMGLESEHQAIYEDTCSKCNNEIEIKLSCWEYPIGAEDTREIKARGARIIQGDCCPDFHNDYGEETTEDDEYSNLKRDAKIKKVEEEEDHSTGQIMEDTKTTHNSLIINKRWWGNWESGKESNWYKQDLFITSVYENGFDFELISINGAHIGEINGYAKFISPYEAKFENTDNNEKKTCNLYFHKVDETMKITEENCSEYHGLHAYFDGNYELKKDIFVKYNKIADDRVLSKIYNLIGKKYWEKFQQCFTSIRGMNDLDNLGVNITVGTVPELNFMQESIIMVDEAKNIWGSFINDEDDKVYYFTSLLEWKKKLPLTIEAWRKKFKEKELVFIDDLLIKDNVYHEFDDEDELENDTFSKVPNVKANKGYNLLIIDTNLEQLSIIRNAFENKGFNPDRVFPRSIESEKFISDISLFADETNILKIRDYIIQAIKDFNIHALIVEPIFGNEEINHPNDAIGSKVIAELEKMDEYKLLPIFVLSHISKYAMVDDLIVSDNILLAEKPYTMNISEMDDVLDDNIIDDLNDSIIQYLEFQPKIKSSKELTLGSVRDNLHDDIYQNLLEIVYDKFKGHSLDVDYLPAGIDEVTITELYMPEELEFKKLIKNDDTYILDIKFEAKAFVWMLVDRKHYDYISLKPLPVRDHNKQYYNAESEETLYIELSVEYKVDKNEKIRDFVIDSINDVELIEDEYSDEREQDIKDNISDEITNILKAEHLKGLDYFQIHDESLPSDDHSALISSYDLPKKIEIENIEIFSNQFGAKIHLEQEVYLDIHILKNEYYSNDEYVSLYGAVEELNKHYVTVEGHALISIELDIVGTRDKDIDSLEALGIEIVDISVVEQIPMNDNADFDSSRIHKTPEEFDTSFDTFYDAIGINPNDASYFYDLGQTYLKMKNYDRAIEVFLKAIRIDSGNDTYYESLGKVYSEIKNYSKVIEAYLKAIDINPKRDTYYINLGEAYNHSGEFSKAKDVFQKAIDINLRNSEDTEESKKNSSFNKDKYLSCKAININIALILKIRLIKKDTRRLSKGEVSIDIRDYYEIYNDLKSKANNNHNNNKSEYDKLLTKIEHNCWKLDLQIIEDSNNIKYLSEKIFRYTSEPIIIDTISSIEKNLIGYMREYDIHKHKHIHLTDFTKFLSKQLGIPRNTVIRILYRWKVFNKVDLAQENCTSDLEINRNALIYILSIK